MKRWAVVTVTLYVAALVALIGPLAIAGFSWGPSRTAPMELLVNGYRWWGVWLWIGLAAAGQALLLVVPVGIAERRPQRRRRLKVPIVTSALFFGMMTLSMLGSVLVGIWKEKPLDALEASGGATVHAFGMNNATSSAGLTLMILLLLMICWIVWAVVFFRSFRASEPDALSRRLTAWLLRGSILELLVAVPCHVIVRERNDCCAPGVTFWGIATGVTVMLMSYGPGVFFLFAARIRALKPAVDRV